MPGAAPRDRNSNAGSTRWRTPDATPVLSEKISTRIKVRTECVKAMDVARTTKRAVPHRRVILTVHEMKRLGRSAAELPAIPEDLLHHTIELELLTGPLQGVYDPSGHGAALFVFFAGMAVISSSPIKQGCDLGGQVKDTVFDLAA
ncbi:recombinase family protein [Embleya hyalina]|uniref:Uncharacterized protein n=1 Tax=Embleya hyalina TaxID=516124 RepID=A0A401YNJ9_9ACTN|nr:recombinase family protein [Embleya hyalina]GCD96171.1 hypothetical protein EHYA_03855 [Embleya hyalina]